MNGGSTMAKARSKAKAKVKSKAKARGKSGRSVKKKATPIPSSATVKYTRHNRWARWTKSGAKWVPKLVPESEVPDDHKFALKTMAMAAQIPCSDTVTYVRLVGGWVRITKTGGYSFSDPVHEEEVPENCK
jgi:hypothetical protein